MFVVEPPVVVGFDVTIAIPVGVLTLVGVLACGRPMVVLLVEVVTAVVGGVLSSSSVRSITPFGSAVVALLTLPPVPVLLVPFVVLLILLFCGSTSFVRACDSSVADKIDGVAVSCR